MNTNYLTIEFDLPLAEVPLESDMYFQILSIFLWNQGVSGIETHDHETFMEWEDNNTPIFDHIHVKLYFSEVISIETFLFELTTEIKRLLKDEEKIETSLKSIHYKINQHEDWKTKWKAFFKPLKISKHIVVKPEWEAYKAQDKEQIININPDMAFGTGLHETTRLVVESLESVFENPNFPSLNTMLDVGAGTGILGMAASKLNKSLKQIELVEIDPVARNIAKENILKNNTENVEMLDVLIEDVPKTYHLVVANIISSILYQIKDELIKKAENILILSGVQAVEKEEFIAHFSSEDLVLMDSYQQGDWVSFIFKKQ